MIVDLTGFDDEIGICDRLWQVSFCAALAHLKQDPSLFFRETPTIGSTSRISDILKIQGFKVKKWDESMGEAEFRLNSFNAPPTPENVKLLKPYDLRISDESFLSLWISMYSCFYPRKDIREKIESIGADRRCVGLHIRFTDKIKENPFPCEIHPAELKRVEERTAYALQKALKKNRYKKVYLATDCSQARQVWSDKLRSWGATVLINEYASYDVKQFRQTSSENFFIDLFSLACCGTIIASINSGVPVAAARIGGMDENQIVWGRYSSRLRYPVDALRRKSKFFRLFVEELKKTRNCLNRHFIRYWK